MYKALQIALRVREEQNCAATVLSHTNLENIHYISHDKRNKRQIEKGWESAKECCIYLSNLLLYNWMAFRMLLHCFVFPCNLWPNLSLLLHSLPFLPEFSPKTHIRIFILERFFIIQSIHQAQSPNWPTRVHIYGKMRLHAWWIEDIIQNASPQIKEFEKGKIWGMCHRRGHFFSKL